MNKPVLYGIDVLLHTAALKQLRLALVTNNAALTTTGILSRSALLQQSYRIVQLFSPEHGITITGADGVAQNNATDVHTGLPIISLYGNKLSPSEEDLRSADAVLFDIPDVGCRFYTYLWTMTHVMEACAQYNKPLIVLDRPNPIGARIEKAEGPFLDEANCSSFIGRWRIPLKHACTLGELALYFAATRLPALNIEVIPVQNYHRHYTAVHDFPFVPTSPAIQNIETAMLYPGMGLLEGVNINEARGTAHPFTMLGAPWMDADKLCAAVQELQLPGINSSTMAYKAAAPPYKDQICYGLQLHVTDAQALNAVHIGISLLHTIAAYYPHKLQERLYKTHANPSGTEHLDKLLGIQHAFQLLHNPSSIPTEVQQEWAQCITPYLLYH